MKQEIINYLKCAYANKVTLAGYTALAVGAACCLVGEQANPCTEEIRSWGAILSIDTALFGLCSTMLGLDTYDTYEKTLNHIKQFGTIREDYAQIKNRFYCSRVAIKLAAKEAGLENTLEAQNDS